MTDDLPAGNYEILREGDEVTIRIDYETTPYAPSLEDNSLVMSRTMDILIEAGNATRIIFSQKRDYEYEYTQTIMLVELARLIRKLSKEKYTYYDLSDGASLKTAKQRYMQLHNILFNILKSDPIGAFVELKRTHRHERRVIETSNDKRVHKDVERYLEVLEELIEQLSETQLIKLAAPYIPGYVFGNRDAYRKIFSPTIKPDFMFTKLMASYPKEAEEIDYYEFENSEVTIYSMPDNIQYMYHLMPPEFKLSEEKYELLDKARNIMAEHKPKRDEFTDPERMRSVFYNVGIDLIDELASHEKLRLKEKDLEELTQILIRYTVGFGLIEILLSDQKVQDVTINSPMGQIPIFIVHQDWTDCRTNILPTLNEAESWASKLRMISGRPLDEANPILDTELIIPGTRARVAVITEPLNPNGLAYAFRRHRDKPWTLPLFMNNRMINDTAAGLLSFLVDGSRTMLVAGTRSAGKSSLLGSLLVEIMRKFRIITIEDTLELPVGPMRKLGYNIQPMKVASAMTKGTTDVNASEGIRTTLRLGDSALIVGEVRSDEARSLYEAMRVGALANVVAGTIHGDSPYGVFDRVVNDLQVPKTSFKATDIIVVANPIKSADGLHRWRRVTEITEVRKFWEDDPVAENGFGQLMKYDSKTDTLMESDALINGDSDILKSIAGNVKEWAGNWDAVWDNIQLRAKIKRAIVDIANKVKNPNLMEAEFVIQANDQFHRISDEIKDESGGLDVDRIYRDYNEWLKREVRRIQGGIDGGI